jgi:TPR repeat protein
LGDDKAQFELATSLFASGDPSSQAEALQWFMKAGDNGLPDGYAKAAEMYQKGIVVSADPKIAQRLYAQAHQMGADQKYGNAAASKALVIVAKVYESDEHKVMRLELDGCKPAYASEVFSGSAALAEAERLRTQQKGTMLFAGPRSRWPRETKRHILSWR